MMAMDEDQIDELLMRWDELRAQGRVVTAEELCQDFPQLLEEVRRRLDNLQSTAWMDDKSDGTEVEPESLVPRTLGKYRLETRLGVGGFGEVWKAFDPALERFVAIKIPRPERLGSYSRFIDEARKIARLRHPGIVTVYDFGRDGEICFIVTELVDGGSLADRIEEDPPDLFTSLKWVVQIADALHHAHQQGIVHRDVKPANVLIDNDGNLVLTDFGIAVNEDEVVNQRPSTPGTLVYMSPEQIEAMQTDRRTDIYSLGIVLYQLLTGNRPYDGESSFEVQNAILEAKPRLPSQLNEQIPETVERMCLKAMAHSPADRYSTAKAFADDLRVFLRPKRHWKKVAAVSSAIIAVLVLTAGRWIRTEQATANKIVRQAQDQGVQAQELVHSKLAEIEKQYGVPTPKASLNGQDTNVERALPDVALDKLKGKSARTPARNLTIFESDIDLSGHDLSVADYEQLGRHFALRRLVLANTPTTDVQLDQLQSVSLLERLDLSGTKISDAAVEKLSSLAALQYLNLARTGITDLSLRQLGSMRLRELSLAGTKVTDDGLQQLAQRNGAGDFLDNLDLSNTAITDASVPSLISMKRLVRLVVKGTKLTDAGVERVKGVLPKCQVER